MSVIISGGKTRQVKASALVSVNEAVADVTRQIEDIGWMSLSTDTRFSQVDDIYDQRKETIKRARMMRERSPLAKAAAKLLHHYVLGQGISYRANNKAKVARIIDEFMEDPDNIVTFTGHAAMVEALDTAFTDGQFFLVLFPDDVLGTVKLGMVDAMFVEDVVTDPDNFKVARWYKVRRPKGDYDFSTGKWQPTLDDDFVYYRDWRNDRDDFTPKGSQIADGLIYHVAVNKRGKFGRSDLAAGLDWLKAHKDFMENRATINAAAATIAWRKKRKTGAAGVQAHVDALKSTLTSQNRNWEGNPAPAPGSTLVENEGQDTEWMKTDTGGTNATADERIMRMMFGSSVGVANHYFGDEANANLATATSMELPMLKNYEAWQEAMGKVLQDVFEFVLSTAERAGRIGPRDDSRRYSERVTTPQEVLTMNAQDGTGLRPAGIKEAAGAPGGGAGATEAPIVQLTLIPKQESPDTQAMTEDDSGAVDWYVSIDFPPIVQKDLNIFVSAIKGLYEMMPASNIESQKLAVELVLQALSLDVEETMARIFPPDLLSPKVVQANADMAGLLGPGTAANPFADGLAAKPEPPQFKKAQESEEPERLPDITTMREARIARFLRVARDASDALAVVGE